ncbi:Putative Transcriptional regulator prz1 [Penicillium brasilianum]|uniref:Putative Transcriptional regulator prz1 n=1 Tax=Penicillium brasilianum TaxID=104259 RepID=A0A0F7TBN6_PENBI|nr:Putative Transcriptional regulator prz1 [Penicillium brasilianum]
MTSDIYDSDDAMGLSPPPKPVKPKYGPDEPPPPPFVTVNQEDHAKPTVKDPKGTLDRSRPGCLEVAAHARDHPYSDWSPKQGRGPVDWNAPPPPSRKEDGPGPKEGIQLGGWDKLGGGSGGGSGSGMGVQKPPIPIPTPKPAPTPALISKPIAGPGSTAEEEAKFKSMVEQGVPRLKVDEKADRHTSLSPHMKPLPPVLPPPAPPSDFKSEFVSPRQRPRLQSITEFPPVRPSPDLLKRSPELGHRVSLPSLQSLSPPSSTADASPDSASCNPNTKTLPSIQSALGGFSPSEFPPTRLNALPPPYPYSSCPGSATSADSPHDRQLPRHFLPSHIPPSPFSHLSPISAKEHSNNPSPASQPSSAFWRGPPPPPPPPPQPAADTPHHIPSPYDTSPMTATSPLSSYPTPTEAPTPGSSERTPLSSTVPLNGAGATGSYKCTHPGCTAAPFQTQYLLNSHANVHSQDRPHFCPVDGCPRGLGGKGFKRKNEMMRHGLVHNSPGYVCPFCPDQQHKYPRPDNLQRHVRVHHVDKSKDDPILRQVLAQRPIGSTRGRRRRSNFA